MQTAIKQQVLNQWTLEHKLPQSIFKLLGNGRQTECALLPFQFQLDSHNSRYIRFVVFKFTVFHSKPPKEPRALWMPLAANDNNGISLWAYQHLNLNNVYEIWNVDLTLVLNSPQASAEWSIPIECIESLLWNGNHVKCKIETLIQSHDMRKKNKYITQIVINAFKWIGITASIF